jgi:hypothetical protein
MQLAQYKGAQGILLGMLVRPSSISTTTDLIVPEVYDTSCRQSFVELTRWFAEISTYVHGPVVKVIVGNKVDKVRGLSHSTWVLSCSHLCSGIPTSGSHCRGGGVCRENGLPLRRDISEDSYRRAKSIPGHCRTYRRKPGASHRLQA